MNKNRALLITWGACAFCFSFAFLITLAYCAGMPLMTDGAVLILTVLFSIFISCIPMMFSLSICAWLYELDDLTLEPYDEIAYAHFPKDE